MSMGAAATQADPLPWLGVSPIFAVVIALIAVAGVVYTAIMQRETGRETVREARKAADAALASAEASDKAATASAAAVTEARRAAPIVLIGCTAADHRALLRESQAPPPLGRRKGECWLSRDGATVRAVFEDVSARESEEKDPPNR
jgi:Tfp pilus assembly protein PilX